AESLLRYWETEFPQIKPHKAGRNVRQYTKEDIETIRVIYNLLKVRGLKIAKARELLKSNKEGAQSNTEVLIQLREIREKLIHLRKAINHIDVDSLPDEQ
ncbi:MAG: MerR family transcriptional regulator, partial [Bacteroidaceae bacterium]|nr:MerR family transcriptional regulator [Bacteroidaceae bacterium]